MAQVSHVRSNFSSPARTEHIRDMHMPPWQWRTPRRRPRGSEAGILLSDRHRTGMLRVTRIAKLLRGTWKMSLRWPRHSVNPWPDVSHGCYNVAEMCG